MAFWVYVLRCSDSTYHTGHTDDLEKRIGQHQSGEMPGYTQTRRPVELMWADSVPTRPEALECEMRIKDWSRAKKEALFRGDFDGVKAVSEASRGSGRRSRQAAMPPARSALETNGEREAATPPAPPSQSSQTPVEQGEALSRPVSRPAAAPPLIILVRPQLGENIGKAARAMLNFGLTEMRLVAPRDGWPNPSAGPAAAGADVVLEQAQLFDTLAEAVADCAHVYATTVRKRGVTKPVLTPEAAVADMAAATGRTAILFGAERSGLETDEVALARSIVTVPINPQFGSLNLAQAVILIAYEWSKRRNAGAPLAQPPLTPLDPPAPQAELDGMIDQLLALLEPRGYFYPPDRAAATRATLRNLLTKPGWNSLEVRTLRGVFSAFEKPRRR